MKEAAERCLETVIEDGEPSPADVHLSQEPLVAVTIASMAIDEAGGYDIMALWNDIVPQSIERYFR